MLHFDREPIRRPRLVALDGGRAAVVPGRARGRSARLAVAFVVVATIVAVVADVFDRAPMWSPVAVFASALVLLVHTLLTRRR